MQAGETIMHKPFVLRYCKDGLMGVTKAVRGAVGTPGGPVRGAGARQRALQIPGVHPDRENKRKRGTRQ